MMTRSELADAIHAARTDRAAAWRFVAAFAADWRTPLGPGDGYEPEDLDAAELRLGVKLPPALREAYLNFGRRDDLLRNQDRLAPPEELEIRHDALIYHLENQGAADWGILLAEIEQEDPPTYYRADLVDKDAEQWEPWTERLSVALVELVMSETALYTADGLSDGGDVSGEEDSLDAFEPLPALLAEQYASEWFLGDDVLVHLAGGCWLTVRARSAEALDAARDAVSAEWVIGS